MQKATWDATRALWRVFIGDTTCFECEFLINACGILNHFSNPNIPGLADFTGQLLHTAAWDDRVDLHKKRVAIIGSGASAIQCLPAIQDRAEHIDMYIRTPSWIVPRKGSLGEENNPRYSDDEVQKFREDLSHSVRVRKDMESYYNSMFSLFFKDSPEQSAFRAVVEDFMARKIKDSSLRENLIPAFDVGCKRINPGEPYLDALQKTNVEAIFDPIDRISSDGVVVKSGTCRQVDTLILATGFDTSFRPRFPIIGIDGVDLREAWKEDPSSYFGLAVHGFPNYLMFLGPNTPIANGSLMGTLEATAEYFIRLLRKAIQQGVSSFHVREDAQDDFDSHTQRFMAQMVWTGTCSSWYKSKSGKILAIWPGSSLHYREVLELDRWEDFDWDYKANRFSTWGQGVAQIERLPDGPDKDLAFYIRRHANLPLEAWYRSTHVGLKGSFPGDHFLSKSSIANGHCD